METPLFPAEIPARLPDWRPRLVAYLAGIQGRPFGYGAHDCALFAAGAIEAMTGCDPAAELRGQYESLRAGLKALRAAGFEDHVAALAGLLEEIPPAFARVGDLVVMPSEGDAGSIGLVQGGRVFVLRPEGLAMVSRLEAARAFRV